MSDLDDPFADHPAAPTEPSGWMRVQVTAPPEVGAQVLDFLQTLGFRDTDWCVMERKDYARVDYDPHPPLTEYYLGGDYSDSIWD